MTYIPAPAEDFYVNHPYYDREHVAYIADRKAEQGVPYCRECHDWHFADEQHSMSEEELHPDA